jgi:hypothetical protein
LYRGLIVDVSPFQFIYHHFRLMTSFPFVVFGTAGHGATHLPDLTNSDDVLNVLALCNFCILANVLDPRTYAFPGHLPEEYQLQVTRRMQFDYNALSPASRQEFTFFRGLALNLISWMGCHFTATANGDQESLSIEELAGDCLRRLVKAILNYKVLLSKKDMEGLPNIIWGDLLRQLQMLLKTKILDVGEDELERLDIGLETYFGRDPGHYRIGRRGDPDNFDGGLFLCRGTLFPRLMLSSEDDPLVRGTTKGDEMFWLGTKVGFQISEGNEGDDESDDNMRPSDSESDRSDNDMEL